MKKFTLFLTILLSGILLFTMATVTYAADEDNDDFWSEPPLDNGVNETLEGNTEENNESLNETLEVNEENNTDNDIDNGISDSNEDENSENDWEFNDEDNSNSTTSNADNLAETGLEDSNGFIALIIMVSIIVAIYSVKKMNDYKNL